MNKETMSLERRKLGELDCAVVDAPGCGEAIEAVVVLCHGFGAPGEDLVPCAPELYSAGRKPLRNTRFVFPAAPIQMDPSGMYDSRAWWPIDMLKLQQLREAGELRDLRAEQPELLSQRRQQVTELIHQVKEEVGLAADRLIIGGFSQGAMLTTDVALSLPDSVGGLIVWSCTLLNEQVWQLAAETKAGLRVVQSHGRADPVLPFEGAELLKSMFAEHQLQNEFIEFSGQHTIPPQAITAAADLAADLLGE